MYDVLERCVILSVLLLCASQADVGWGLVFFRFLVYCNQNFLDIFSLLCLQRTQGQRFLDTYIQTYIMFSLGIILFVIDTGGYERRLIVGILKHISCTNVDV